MSDEIKIKTVEPIETLWVVYLCSNPDCKSPNSSRADKRNFEREWFLQSEKNIPEQMPCPTCGSPMTKQ
jgi:hypothetical protein